MRKIHKVIFFAFESHKPCFKTGDCYKVASYIYMNMYILLTYESITSNVIKDATSVQCYTKFVYKHERIY